MKAIWKYFSKALSSLITFDQIIPFWKFYVKEINIGKALCTKIFIGAIYVIAKIGRKILTNQ